MAKRRRISARVLIASCAALLLMGAGCGENGSEEASGGADEGEAEGGFYEGKTLRLVAPSSPGGGTDTITRIYARYFEKYLEGSPSVIVENMGGGGGVVAHNYLYNVAESDGLTAMTTTSTPVTAQVLGQEGVDYDYGEFEFVGNTHGQEYMIFFRSDTGFSSLEEAAASGEKLRIGAQDTTHPTLMVALVAQEAIGADMFSVVAGFEGGAEVELDLERGGIDAAARSAGPFLQEHADWLEDGFVVPVGYTGEEPHPDWPDVPTITELAAGHPEEDRLLNVMKSSGIDRSLIVPPGFPEEAKAELATALEAMLEDEAFLEEFVAAGFEPLWTPGADNDALVDSLLGDPEIASLYELLASKATN